MIDTLVLIDAKNLCYRAHWVHRFLASRGRSTSVLFGALKMLVAVARRMPGAAFVWVWDGQGKTWRHELSKGIYKANRGEPNEDITPALKQLPILRAVLYDAGFRHFEFSNLEGDDLIGILSAAALEKGLFEKVVIYSTDKDFYQLVNKSIGVMRGHDKNNIDQIMGVAEIAEELGLPPKVWVSIRALTGDPTDNIPKAAPGIGPKTAIKMIAAGLDPTVPDFKKLPWAVRQNFGLLATRWPVIRQSYELSQIVKSPDDERLPEEMRGVLKKFVDGLRKESFLRDQKKVKDENLSDLTNFIMDYEMAELFEDRLTLWRMP